MLHTIALTLIPRIGSKTLNSLLDIFGSAQAVFGSDAARLLSLGLSQSIVKSIVAGDTMVQASNIIDHCNRSGIRILVKGQGGYPAMLSECVDAPGVLYVRGSFDFSEPRKYISVVGTRKATTHGVNDTERLIGSLKDSYSDVVVVSGLAFGIDKAAHLSALNNSLPTVAVMPGWVDDITPMSHYYIAKRIINSSGAVISDMPPGTVIGRSNFLSRNRIIAGLSHATFVVESAAKGGSLVTADLALSYDREVFAMSGRSDDPSYMGTNNLIKSSRAQLYQDVSDLAHVMGWVRDSKAKPQDSDDSSANLSPALMRVFSAMPDTAPTTIEAISDELVISMAQASSALSMLEIMGLIKSIPGRMYQKAKY